MTARDKVFAALSPETYQRHALHDLSRDWPETNCYLDIWIEVLAALGLPPEAALGFAITQDFEGDQFTFFKVPLEDLETLFGLRVTELAIYDRVELHVAEQIRRGRLCLVELDSFFLPDTQGTAYRKEHGKTTVAINRLDMDARQMDYFHNLGLHRLEGRISTASSTATPRLMPCRCCPIRSSSSSRQRGLKGRKLRIAPRRFSPAMLRQGLKPTRCAVLRLSLPGRWKPFQSGLSASSISMPSTPCASWARISSCSLHTLTGFPQVTLDWAASHRCPFMPEPFPLAPSRSSSSLPEP